MKMLATSGSKKLFVCRPLIGFTSYHPKTRFMATSPEPMGEVIFVQEPGENVFIRWIEDDMGLRYDLGVGMYHNRESPAIVVKLKLPTYNIAINGQRLPIVGAQQAELIFSRFST